MSAHHQPSSATQVVLKPFNDVVLAVFNGVSTWVDVLMGNQSHDARAPNERVAVRVVSEEDDAPLASSDANV